jgi:hypothetical protein
LPDEATGREGWLKGERVEKARRGAREGLPLSDRIPGWLTPGRDETRQRTFTENPDRVDIVGHIFDETAKGFGRRAIVKEFNRDEKKSFALRLPDPDAVPEQGKAPKGGIMSALLLPGTPAATTSAPLAAKDVERWLVHQLNPAAIAITFKPAAKRSGRSQK